MRPGQRHTPETLAKISAAHTGKIVSADARARMSEAGKQRGFSPETRAKLAASRTGKPLSAETRAKIGAANRGNKTTAETRAKISAKHTGRKMSDATRAKMSASTKSRTPVVMAKLQVAQASGAHKCQHCGSRTRFTAVRTKHCASCWESALDAIAKRRKRAGLLPLAMGAVR